MVQVLEDFSPTSQRFAGFSKLLQGIGSGAERLKGELDERSTRQALAERFGDIFKDVRNPDVRKQLLGGELEKESQAAKLAGEHQFDQNTYDIIEKRFGKEEADLYRSITEGGKTKLIDKLLEEEERSRGLSNKLEISKEDIDVSDVSDEIKGEVPEKSPKKIVDFDKGLTPSERTRRQDARYKTNLPIFTESSERRRAAETEKEELAILEDLSPRISGLERLNINPFTGNLILPGAASEDAQRYVKTINDFTRNAKNSYGSRVTNFDLQQFMKRLPTLANSQEGRRQIIKQLQLINDIDLAHSKTLHNVFDEYGGIRNIDYDKALTIAEKRSSKEVNKLKSQFKEIGKDTEREYQKQVKEFKAIVPKDHVAVRKADGSMGYIPKGNVAAFLKAEGNEVL